MKLHPGIHIDRIPVEGSVGAIFAVGTATILLIGLPEVRIFFLVAAAGGLAAAALIRFLR